MIVMGKAFSRVQEISTTVNFEAPSRCGAYEKYARAAHREKIPMISTAGCGPVCGTTPDLRSSCEEAQLCVSDVGKVDSEFRNGLAYINPLARSRRSGSHAARHGRHTIQICGADGMDAGLYRQKIDTQ